jgi:hypothetical protein
MRNKSLTAIDHLFFKCFVASKIWEEISGIFGVQVGSDFESVARWWISNKKKKYCAKYILLCCTLVPMVSKK